MKYTSSIIACLIGAAFFLPSAKIYASAQSATPAAKSQSPAQVEKSQTAALDMGEDPGPLYTRLVKEWADTTHFAQNAAEVAVGKLQLDMQNDPKLQKILSKNLIADLQQFFYELFISPQTVQALAKVYAQYFTLEEMQALIDFYRSPLGQKLIKSNSEITLKTQQIGINLLKENEKGYLKIIAKYVTAAQPKS